MSDYDPTDTSLLGALRKAIWYSENYEVLLPDVDDDESPTGYATNPTLMRLRELAEVLAGVTPEHLALIDDAISEVWSAAQENWNAEQDAESHRIEIGLRALQALLRRLLPPDSTHPG
jgi:hypothetical protein